jgi:hypothetical protein
MIEITIRLQLTGNDDDAYDIVSNVLDGGVLQDAINEYESDNGSVQVVSAVIELQES